MKTKIKICCTALISLVFLLVGCNTPTTVSSSTNGSTVVGAVTNDNIGIVGSWNSDTGEWTAGIVITFKEAPSAENVALLKVAGAVPVNVVSSRTGVAAASSLEYCILKVDRANQDVQYAIRKAREAGATISPLLK